MRVDHVIHVLQSIRKRAKLYRFVQCGEDEILAIVIGVHLHPSTQVISFLALLKNGILSGMAMPYVGPAIISELQNTIEALRTNFPPDQNWVVQTNGEVVVSEEKDKLPSEFEEWLKGQL